MSRRNKCPELCFNRIILALWGPHWQGWHKRQRIKGKLVHDSDFDRW